VVIDFVSGSRQLGDDLGARAAHSCATLGELQYYEGTVEDITASHLAQLALAQNEERWKLALESTGDGVWDWYVQTGVEYFSRRCKEIYGFAEDEIADRSEALDGRTHPDDLAQMQRAARLTSGAKPTPTPTSTASCARTAAGNGC
jgi:PAS domain S-box-containing protein